jgi:hypothetical protein
MSAGVAVATDDQQQPGLAVLLLDGTGTDASLLLIPRSSSDERSDPAPTDTHVSSTAIATGVGLRHLHPPVRRRRGNAALSAGPRSA